MDNLDITGASAPTAAQPLFADTPADTADRLPDDTRPSVRVGITHGDTNGVGYELIFKTFADPAMLSLCTPVVYGSPKVATYHRKAINSEVNFTIVPDGAAARSGRLNLVSCFDDDVKVDFGHSTSEGGRAAFLALERATEELREGKIDVLVTAPIDKASIQQDGFRFAGQTEYLEQRLGSQHGPLMVLMNDRLRVAVVTTHLPLAKVAEAITPELVELKLRLLQYSLRHDFLIPMPRIAVLGLNPHNGDGGLNGSEEQDVIRPVVEKLVGEGKHVFGPYAADGFFGAAQYRHFDGVLAMYHDQGLAPFKALSGGEGVNFTAGLNYVRTSPDHGTAYDIAGQGVASEESFRAAIYRAIDIFRSRTADDEARSNPLPKLYHDRREDGDRPRRYPREQASEAPATGTPAENAAD